MARGRRRSGQARGDLSRSLPEEPTEYELIRASSVQIRVVDWLWSGHLARGDLEITAGLPGIGKSQIQCSHAASITTLKAWPDGSKSGARGEIIMLTAEDSKSHTLCPRLIAAGADLDRIHILGKIRKDSRGRMFLLHEDIELLAKIIAGNPLISLITIDPITAFMGGKLDSHRATDVRNQLGPLADLAERSHVAISAITHPPKHAGMRALDMFIGSQAFIAAARIGHVCIPEMEESESGNRVETGRALFATPKHTNSPGDHVPTLAFRLEGARGGRDEIAGADVMVSRVIWRGDRRALGRRGTRRFHAEQEQGRGPGGLPARHPGQWSGAGASRHGPRRGARLL